MTPSVASRARGRRPAGSAKRASARARRSASAGLATDVARLQRTAGNAAVARLLADGLHERDGGPGVVPSSVEAVTKRGGEPLEPTTRNRMESAFDHDFGDVRVHHGPSAGESAQDVNAHAYTVGRDIVFGPGQYAPHTASGRQLLAHELAHVVQQRGHGTAKPGSIEPQGSPLEHDAERVAGAAMAGTDTRSVPGSAPSIVQRASGPVLCRQIANRLNYDHLAARIRKAVQGLGTDEEGTYLALQQLQRDPEAIRLLKAKYQEKYNESLEAAIREDFSGEELEYALQLLNMGRFGSAQAVGAVPTTDAEYDAAARRIWRAVERWGTDEEAIFAVLLPFARNERLIARLTTAYLRISNGELLSSRLDSELSGSEYDYARYLMGGPAIQADPEIKDVSLTEATELFDALKAATFVTSTGERSPVPFFYPIDGCYDRAYVMSQLLTERGIATQKVFAVFQVAGPVGPRPGLRVETEYGRNVPPGTPPAVEWSWHVAPVVRVRQPQGGVTEMVLDPSLADAPITIAQWTGRMSSGQFRRVTLDDIRALLRANQGQYPTGERLVFTTDRNVYELPSADAPSPGPREAGARHEQLRPVMTAYSTLAVVHRLAGAIRRELARTPIDANRIVAVITAAPLAARSRLWTEFPSLRMQLHTAVTDPADMIRIEAAVSAP